MTNGYPDTTGQLGLDALLANAETENRARNFESESGYSGFLGIYAEPLPRFSRGEFPHRIISAYVARELKVRLVPIEARYRLRPVG